MIYYIDCRLQKEGMPCFFLFFFVLLFYCYHYCSFSCCSCSASSLSWFCWYCCCLFVWCLFAWSLSEYFQAANCESRKIKINQVTGKVSTKIPMQEIHHWVLLTRLNHPTNRRSALVQGSYVHGRCWQWPHALHKSVVREFVSSVSTGSSLECLEGPSGCHLG